MRLLKRLIKLGIAGYIALLLLIIFANTGLSNVNWPFELFLSYIRHVLIIAPIIAICAWFVWRKSIPVLIIAVLITALPFFMFSKFENPNKKICLPENCLTILSINLRGRESALQNFANSEDAKNADIIGLYELPYRASERHLSEIFPEHKSIFLMRVSPLDGKTLGSFIVLLSKDAPLRAPEFGVSDRHPRWADRGFISAEYEIREARAVNIIAVHPRLPLSHASTEERNKLLTKVSERATHSENFIIMGDFNLTPWTPEFRKLPGKRAGDPRFISTWDVQRPWTGIPIDHIMVSESLDVVEAEVLAPVGSDHAPVMARVKVKP